MKGHLSPDTTLAAAQVFTGLAAIGAVVVAVVGIAKQFEKLEARLGIVVVPWVDSTSMVLIQNSGNAPAHNLIVGLLGSEVASFNALPPWRPADQTADGNLKRFRYEGLFVPGTETLLVPGTLGMVIASAPGIPEAVWQAPSPES